LGVGEGGLQGAGGDMQVAELRVADLGLPGGDAGQEVAEQVVGLV